MWSDASISSATTHIQILKWIHLQTCRYDGYVSSIIPFFLTFLTTFFLEGSVAEESAAVVPAAPSCSVYYTLSIHEHVYQQISILYAYSNITTTMPIKIS